VNFFKSMERGLAWGVGRELAHGVARGTRTTAAQRKVLAAIEQRKSLLASKYVTDQTVVAYVGDKVRFVDTSHAVQEF